MLCFFRWALGHKVQLVEPTNGERKWSIRVKDLQKNAVVNESFDAVMVCNSHYFEPSIPTLIAQNIFQAQPMHNHDYREPEIFANKVCIVLLDTSTDLLSARVDSNTVTPLRKHLVSIENPTLALIGLPLDVCALFDLQVRFVLKFWHGKKDLPSEVDMLREERDELEKREMEGLQKMHFHMMGPNQRDYYDDHARITPLPPVFANLYNKSSAGFLNDFLHYRENRYTIIDDYNYIRL